MLFDLGTQAKIVGAGMDGSDKHDIISKDIKWPNGITVDKVTDRIFWADAHENSLSSAK